MRTKKRIISILLAFVMAFSALNAGFGIKAEAGVGTIVYGQVSTVVTTIVKRKVVGMIAEYGNTDKAGSTVAGLVYQYLAGPQGIKINSILANTKKMSEQLDKMDDQLKDIDKKITDGFQDIKNILVQQDVADEQERITRVTALYLPAYQKYEMLLDEISEKHGDMDGDGDVDADDINEVDKGFEVVYETLPVSADFKDSMTLLADIVSDNGGGVSIKPNDTGSHNQNDSTYIKSVKVATQTKHPFTFEVELAMQYAGTYVFQQQIQMLILYQEMMSWLEGKLDDTTNLSQSDIEEYTKAYKRLSQNYDGVYNMTINSMNNAGEQLHIEDIVPFADLSVNIDGLDVYQVQLNEELVAGMTFMGGKVYYIPKKLITNTNGIEESTTNYQERAEQGLESATVYNVTDHMVKTSDLTKFYIKPEDDEFSVSSSLYRVVEDVSVVAPMFEKQSNFNSVDFLNLNGIEVDSTKDVQFLFNYSVTREDDKNIMDKTIKRESTAQFQSINGRSFSSNTAEDDLTALKLNDVYKDENFGGLVFLERSPDKEEDKIEKYKIEIEKPSYINVDCESKVEPNKFVKFTVDYDSENYIVDDIYALRANGGRIEVSSDSYAGGVDHIECEFLSAYQDMKIVVDAHEEIFNVLVDENIEHGDVTCEPLVRDNNIATFNVRPNDGYVVDTLSVKNIFGDEIEVNDNYEFVMPKSNVEVEASFKKAESFSKELNGEGTENSPYLISSINDWNSFASVIYNDIDTNGLFFEITENLDFSKTYFSPIGKETTEFNGTLLGNGNVISGFTKDEVFGNKDRITIFSAVGENGTVDGITFEDIKLNGNKINSIFKTNKGIISNIIANIEMECQTYQDGTDEIYNSSMVIDNFGTIENCTSKISTTNGDNAGIAINNYKNIIDCNFEGNMQRGSGIAALNKGLIESCVSDGMFTNIENSVGLVGYNDTDAVINKCINKSDLTSSSDMVSHVAGIVGYNLGRVSNCANFGDIGNKQASYVAGLCAYMGKDAELFNSYNIGNVEGYQVVAGAVGTLDCQNNTQGQIKYCYSSGKINDNQYDDENYIASFIGMVKKGFIAPSANVEDIANIVNTNFVLIDEEHNMKFVGNYDNDDILEYMVKFTAKTPQDLKSMAIELNKKIKEYNKQNGGKQLLYWTVKGSVSSINPCYADDENEAIFGDDPTPSPEATKIPETDVPNTGDNGAMAYVMLCMISFMAIFALKRRKAK